MCRWADRHDHSILAIAATDHFNLLRAEHRDRVGAAGVEQIGPRRDVRSIGRDFAAQIQEVLLAVGAFVGR